MINFIDGLLIGLLITILFYKIRGDRQMKKVTEIRLTKEEAKKMLEDTLKLMDDDLPIEREDDNE